MPIAPVVAQETLFLGEDLLPWLLLAFGAALVVANVAALIRPPRATDDGNAADDGERLERPPLGRVLPYIVVGSVVSAWAVATLLQ